jgi:hypothetical protein
MRRHHTKHISEWWTFYADDIILFIKHDLKKAKNLKLILSAFEKISGHKINFHKWFGNPVIHIFWAGLMATKKHFFRFGALDIKGGSQIKF